ncbi:unnamed protein product [Natator depressus]
MTPGAAFPLLEKDSVQAVTAAGPACRFSIFPEEKLVAFQSRADAGGDENSCIG